MMRTHDEFEHLSAYLDGELGDAERALVEDHLAGCASCRAMLDGLRATTAEMRALEAPAPRPADSVALRAAIARAKARPRRAFQALGALGGAAAVIIGFIAFAGGSAPTQLSREETGAAVAPTADYQTLDADFDEDSARKLLATSSHMTAGTAAAEAPEPQAQQAESADRVKGFSGDGAIDWASVFPACEREVFADAPEPYTVRRLLAATYRGEPAAFMIFDVGDPPDRRELWVMAADDCSLLFFAQS